MASPKTSVGISIEVRDSTMEDLGPALDDAAALGVASVELPLHEMDIVCGARVLAGRLAVARAAVAGRPLRYSLHGHLGIDPMTPPPADALHADLLRANVEVAAELGCRHLVVHSGFHAEREPAAIEAAYARQREALARAGAFAETHGVVLCVENVFTHDGRGRTATPAKLAEELGRIDHPSVRATFDFGHGLLNVTDLGGDYLAEARALAPFAGHLHVHDGFGRPKDIWTTGPTEDMAFGIGDLHLPFGWGAIPWSDIARGCAFPPDVVANIELAPRFWSEARTTVRDVARWAATLRAAA
jgi:sugar phosphate isomerase/epimerase